MSPVVYATAATRELALAADRAFAEAHPTETLAWAAQTFGSRLVVTSSMADEVVAHLASQAAPGVDLVFLDTGYHFPETIRFRHELAARLDVSVVDVAPEQTIAEQDATYGPRLFSRDPDACCTLRNAPCARSSRCRPRWSRTTPGSVGYDGTSRRAARPRGSSSGTPCAGRSRSTR
jgi:phosphoadenosine phosphosulfate reductase